MITRRHVLALTGGVLALPRWRSEALAASPVIRLASVKYGTVNWLVDTLRKEGLDKKYGFDLRTLEVANNQAGPISLLSGQADVIVSDWTWAMRQRAKGDDIKFAPYSSALGSLLVPKDSPIKSLTDLAGKKIGVAGSSIDKSWVLLRAYSKKMLGKDIATIAEPTYGAAPLITEEFKNGRLDACLNYWTYAARLEGTGARQLISMAEVIKNLEISPTPPLVGFIWSAKTTAEKAIPIDNLLAAVHDANAVLAKSDEAWERIRPLVRPANDTEFAQVKAYFRSGITTGWGQAETASAEKMAKLLTELGDSELVGNGTRFDPKLFHNQAG